MFHSKRQWQVASVESADALAEKLTNHSWTGCTAFQLGDYFFLNDAFSPDGAQEYAVLRRLPDGRYEQIESITFSWCTPVKALKLIQQILAGEFDQVGWRREVQPNLVPSAQHGRCYMCA